MPEPREDSSRTSAWSGLSWRRPQADRGLVRELQSSGRATVLTLCAMLVLSLLSSAYLILVSQPRAAELTQLSQHSRQAFAAMLSQETGLRGWLATSDEVFFDPVVDGIRTQEVEQAFLLEQSPTPEITQTVVDTVVAAQAWREWGQRAASMHVREGDRTSGRLTEFLLVGKDLFDQYRVEQDESTTYITAERDQAISDQRNALIAVLVTTLALLAFAGTLALRRGRRLRRTVARPMRQLLATIGALGSGDLSARSARTGVSELDAVGDALGDLATDLQHAGDDAVAREARLTLLAARFETVVRVARETSASLSARYVSETVTSAASDLLGTRTTLWVRGDEGAFLAARRSDDPHGVVPPSALGAPAVVANAAADARPAADGQVRAYPLLLAGMVVGVLEATAPQYDQDVEHVLDALLSTAAAALEAARLHSSVRELAHVDALTRLPNRRRLESDIETEWERSSRYQRPLSFVMLDLDHFKQLNDQYGHLVGDTVLHETAVAIAAVLRSSDTAYRYGGEEFAVLLRETGTDQARAVAERLRVAIAGVALPETAARVTASLGVASASDAMVEHLELIADADAALYEAKRSGRDRVVVASAVGVVPISG